MLILAQLNLGGLTRKVPQPTLILQKYNIDIFIPARGNRRRFAAESLAASVEVPEVDEAIKSKFYVTDYQTFRKSKEKSSTFGPTSLHPYSLN